MKAIYSTTNDTLVISVNFWGYSRYDADCYDNFSVSLVYDFNNLDSWFFEEKDSQINTILSDVYERYGKKLYYGFNSFDEVAIFYENGKKKVITDEANEWQDNAFQFYSKYLKR